MLAAPRGGPGFTFAIDTLAGTTPSGATSGTVQVTAPGSNSDGSEVALFSALARDVCYVVLGISNFGVSANSNGVLLDLLIDPAGGTSYGTFVDDLICGATSALAGGSIGQETIYHFPLWIPAGASLGIRARRAGTGSRSGNVQAWLYGEPTRPQQWWCGQRVESLGINAASSTGTSHTPGSTGSYSSWATIGTSTKRYGAGQFAIQYPGAVAGQNGYHWQIGVGSQQLPGSPTFYATTNVSEIMGKIGHCQPLWCDIPSGTAVQVRGVSSNAGATQSQDVAFYGVY